MMNFLNGLVPKSLIVGNIVDTLKKDPQTGIIKLFEMTDKFASGSDYYDVFEQVKEFYAASPVAKMYLKNLIYNTNKACLKSLIQNVAIHHLMEGLPKRSLAKAEGAMIPDAINIHFEADMTKISIADFESSLERAKDLGIHIIVLTGKFNLKSESFINTCKKHPDILFVPIIHADTITTDILHNLKDSTHFVPILMIKTLDRDTLSRLGWLKSSGVLYGTMTSYSEEAQKTSDTDDKFILDLIRQASRVHFYLTTDALTQNVLKEKIDHIRQTRPIPVFHLRSDGRGNLIATETIEGKVHDVLILRQTLI